MSKQRILVAAASLVVIACSSSPASSSAPAVTAPAVTAKPVATAIAPPVATPSATPAGSAVVPEGLIAFDRFDANGGAEGPYLGTFIVRGDGTSERRIEVPTAVDQLAPMWSTDGRQLLVTISVPPPDLNRPAIIDADGTGLTPIKVKTDRSIGCSDRSPDGKTLLCSISSGEHPDVDGIYTIRTDGSHLTRLTTSPFHDTVGTAGECGGGDGRGVYSPDGSQIVFIRQQCGTGPDPSSDETAAIERMDRDGGHQTEILPQGGVTSHPGSQLSWSPDGSAIAFGDPGGELHTIRPDGTGLRHIALDPGPGRYYAAGPAWSPDGKRLVFTLFREALLSSDLYTVSPDGSGLTKITDTPGAEAWARWGPDPAR